MSIEAYCLRKLAAVEDYPFGPDAAVFKVGNKIFALTSPPGSPTNINLKCEPTLAIALRQKHAAITPGYHMNKVHWNSVALDGSVPTAEVERMVDMSYELVVGSLPRPARDALGK